MLTPETDPNIFEKPQIKQDYTYLLTQIQYTAFYRVRSTQMTDKQQIVEEVYLSAHWVTQEAQFPLDWDSQWERAEFLQR